MYIQRLTYLVRNALPLVTSSIGLMLLSLVDTMTASHLGNHVLVAQSLAAIINMTIFMGLAAFIFPIANLCHLNVAEQHQYLTIGLLIIIPIGILITGVNWFGANYLATSFLPIDSQRLFVNYYQYGSFRILPVMLFFYLRMVIYTDEKPVQLSHYMLIALLMNIVGNLYFYHWGKNPLLVMKYMAVWGGIIFIMLGYAIHSYLPPSKKLLSLLLNRSWSLSALRKVLQMTLPSMLTSYLEYLFFCVIGIILLKNIPDHLSIYRVVLQLEEMFILVFYGLSAVISLEISKQIKTEYSWFHSDARLYIGFVFITAILLFFLLPNLFLLFDMQIQGMHLIYLINAILLISECIMLLSLSWLRGLGKNQVILGIMFSINWIIIFPYLYLAMPKHLYTYLYALIINYCLISTLAFFLFKRFLKRV